MYDSNASSKIKEYNIEMVAIGFLIANSILYLLIFRKLKAKAIDEMMGEYGKIYPDTRIITYTIAIIFLVVSGIFLYYSYIDLQQRIEQHNKTGQPASLEPYYNYFYIQILQFTVACYFFYNVFVVSQNESSFFS